MVRTLECVEEMKKELESFKEAEKVLENFEKIMKLVRKYPLNPDYFQIDYERWDSNDSRPLNY